MTMNLASAPTRHGALPQPGLHRLGDIPGVHAALKPDAPAIIFEDRVTTWRALDEASDRVAAALVAAGLPPQARIGYLGKNSDRLLMLLLGAAKADIVTVPINWRLAPAEVEGIVADTGLELLFAGEPMFFQTCAAAVAACPAAKQWVAMEGEPPAGIASFDDWIASHPAAPCARAVSPQSAVLQFYTSGTTGRPKGVMISHSNLISFRELRRDGPSYDTWWPDDVAFNALPMAHVGGMNLCLKPLYSGAQLVLMRELVPARVLDAIDRYGVTTFCLVPSALHILLSEPRTAEVEFSHVRLLTYGSAAMPLELLKRGLEVIGCDFAQGYGMTETCGLVTMLGPEDHSPEGSPHMGSVGRPLPGVEVRVVDADRRDLPPGEIGEVAIRSPSNMIGYWNQPEATARTLDADNWLYTGDGGYLDDAGYLYICDRIKDMVITGGENVYPAEVENAIFGHPAVDQVAVIGLPDPKWGETVTAVIIAKPGAERSADDIIAWARARIAAFKAPKRVIFVDDLPRNASGKVLKHELRAKLGGG